MKLKINLIYPGTLLILMALACIIAFTSPNDFNDDEEEIMLRKIGHELLLQAGDSISRVLPISRPDENEYRITFENELTFQPDSLVAIIKRSIALQQAQRDYVVNVLNCDQNEVVYGYAILTNKKKELIPCLGRQQEKRCYIIQIRFNESALSKNRYLLGSLPFIAFAGIWVSRSYLKRKQKKDEHFYQIGRTRFDHKKRTLTINKKEILLTSKESRLLLFFARSPGELITRERLQKEIWEDEGVIVGRSLDVFISRLRKKLESDEGLQLINIHNKGYKLKIVKWG